MSETETCGLLEQTLGSSGSAAALDHLEQTLIGREDYWGWFYTGLMRARLAMGASPTPTAGSGDLSSDQQEEY